MPTLLDVAHALAREDVERAALAERQNSVVMVAIRGGSASDLLDVAAVLDTFEAELVAPPAPDTVARIDPEQLALRQALGVA